jgi:sugar/nucleoside kinase (ribokinase family)
MPPVPAQPRTLHTSPTIQDMHDIFQNFHQHGPDIVIITNGAQGVYVSDKKNIYFHPPIIDPRNVVNTVGAGDAFGSAFVGTFLRNQSIDDALRAGIINSSSVIAHVGAQAGLLTQGEIEEKINALPKNSLKIDSL